MFSLLGKQQRKIPKSKNYTMNTFTVVITGYVVLLATWSSAIEALPSKESKVAADNDRQESTLAAPASLRRFTRGQVLYLQHCADCHGWEGRGDGPLTAVLASKPPVLHQTIGIFAHNSDAHIVARILSGVPLRTIQAGTPPYTDEEVASLVTYLQQLPTRDWENIERGKGVYDSLCAACHGLYGRGDGLGMRSFAVTPPDLTNSIYQQSITNETLIRRINNGKDAMPGASDVLTPHEIRTVVTFLRVLSPGYELYSRFCAYCHGTDGTPVPTKPAQTGSSASRSPRFDSAYFRTHTTAQIRTFVPHMRRKPRPTMPHLARQLSSDEALEIIRYLRTLTPIK